MLLPKGCVSELRWPVVGAGSLTDRELTIIARSYGYGSQPGHFFSQLQKKNVNLYIFTNQYD